ncbi:MAG: hypothetical protein QM730_21275 [Anaerolineales bacterium]
MTVKALGWEKTASIYYEAQVNLLGIASNYSDLYYILQQACVNVGYLADDCFEVKKALDAVQMNTPVTGTTSNQASAPLCPVGMITTAAVTSFTETFDDANETFDFSGWTKMSDIYSSPASAMNTLGGNGVFQTLTMKDGILIKPNSYLHFHHAYDFEVYQGANYDGGVVEYSTDNGNTWIDASALFSTGDGYNGTLATYTINPNPLQGRRAFTGTNFPYYLSPTHMVSSRFDLSKLANKVVKFRFAYGTDMAEYWRGWFIDDVRVYQCVGTPAIPVVTAPAVNMLITDYTPLLNWSDTTPAIHHYQVQVSTDKIFTSPLYDVNNLATSEFTIPTDLLANATYFWHVRSFNAIDSSLGWSPTWSFRTALTPPVLSTPTEGEHLSSLRPAFEWEDVSGATGYTIQISTVSSFATIANTSNPVASAYTPSVDLPKGKLYWRVRANGANGPSLWTTRSYQGPYAPAAPVPSLPANNTLLTDYTPLLKWSILTIPASASSFDHYHLQVATDTGFTALVLEQDISGVTNNTFTPPTDLASNTKYYWRVQGVNTLPENGAWSTVWSFRTALLPVTLNALQNGNTLRPTFSWNDSNGAPLPTSYTVQIAAVSNFSILLTSGSPTTNNFTPSINLPAGKLLYWRVRANGVNGPSLWTSGSFTTPTPPSTATLFLPANASLSSIYTPTLKWSAVTSVIAFDHYQVQVDDDPSFGTPVVDDVSHNLASQNTLTTSALPHNTKFFWRVLAFNTSGQYSTSAVWSFRTALLPVTLNALQNGNTLRPTFSWNDPNGAPLPTSYTIQIAAVSNFSTLLTSGSPTTNNFTPSINLPAGKLLYWRVRANGINGPSLWTTGSFTTPTPPSVPTLLLPATNSLNTNYTPTLKWSVVTSTQSFAYYQVQVDDDPLFGTPVVGDVSHNLASQNTLTTSALPHNTKFYWRVLAFNNLGQYSISPVWSFRTVVDAPTLLTPATGTPAGTLKPTFDWDTPTGPVTGYTIQVATSNTFTTLLVNSTTTDSSYTRLTNLPAGKTLYWRVKVNGPNGPSAWSTVFSFTTP